MKYAHALTCMAGLFQAAAGLPSMTAETRQTTCTSPRLRKSWTATTSAEKKAYIDAALCLTKKTSKLGLAGATIHDDFAWVHNKLSNQIHSVAAFLPWHRYFIQVYENALKTECGYTGTALYWDWVADAAAPRLAAVWDPDTGFGGNGTGIANTKYSFCVNDGPFANIQLRFYGNDTVTHCLQRQFVDAIPQAGLQEMLGFNYDQRAVNNVLASTPYLSFHSQLEGGPHASIHGGVGGSFGDMGPLTSPNDPIFFLHHTQVDRVWWMWQQQSSSNLLDYAGNVWPEDNTGRSATLDDIMPMGGLAADRKVRDFMDAANAELCYTYES